MGIEAKRRLFTVEEYYQMARSGILSEDDRVELLAGEIVQMSPIGSRHAACVDRLTKSIDQQIGDAAILRVQSPIRLNHYSEPQPDLALLKPRGDFYVHAHPGPGDILLVIEVAETSVELDRRVKIPLYAQAGIPEVWIVDLEAGCVEVYENPSHGSYQAVKRYTPKQQLSPRAFPNLKVDLKDILGTV
jgi:Uma2 family endonuclease